MAAALDPAWLDDAALRAPEVAEAASRVSALPEVRAAFLGLQRAFARQPGGAVLDGRDIGTVIAPDAPAKLYVTASAEVRAARRARELRAQGLPVDESAVLAELRARDARDAARAAAPLRRAADAALLDTTDLDIGEAVRRAIEFVSARQGRS